MEIIGVDEVFVIMKAYDIYVKNLFNIIVVNNVNYL